MHNDFTFHVPDFDRWYRWFGASLMLGMTALCAMAFGNLEKTGEQAIATIGLAFCVLCFAALIGWSSEAVIDRARSTVTQRRGFVHRRKTNVWNVAPTAIRVTLDQEYVRSSTHYVSTLYLVHEDGEILLGKSWFSIRAVRQCAEQLAYFLELPYYEDRLYLPEGGYTGSESRRTQVVPPFTSSARQ